MFTTRTMTRKPVTDHLVMHHEARRFAGFFCARNCLRMLALKAEYLLHIE